MRLPKRILVGVDFSESSARALAYAHALATACGATLVVVHAIAQPAMAGVDLDATERLARLDIDDLLNPLRRPGLEVVTAIRWADAHVAIAQTAKDAWVDLVVLGTRGKGGLSRALLGSVAHEVVREVDAPVLLLRALADGEPAPPVQVPPKSLLVATDFGDAAERTLSECVDLARTIDGASITLVHAYSNVACAATDGALAMSDLTASIVRSAQDSLALAIEQHEDTKVPIIGELREPPADDAVIAVAEEVGADLVAVGTHARGGVGRLLLGSVAESIIHKSARPVLVFRKRA